jgi:MFS family permease
MDNNTVSNKNTMFLVNMRTFFISSGATTASSFIGVYGVILGASPIEMGILLALGNSISNATQIFFGKLSDNSGLRKPWLIMASIFLSILWLSLSFVSGPVELIIIYAAISLASAVITVNWFALLTDITSKGNRGSFMAGISNISSIGNLVTLIFMTFLLKGDEKSYLIIPFSLASIGYILSAIFISLIKETRKKPEFKNKLLLKSVKDQKNFYKYMKAMMLQGFFWSMAWPIFPITVILVRNFTLPMVAILTTVNISATIVIQYYSGKIADKANRIPYIFMNRLLLGGIPLMYALFTSFSEFLVMEVYAGVISGIQNVTMNSYLMDLLPDGKKAEYISIMNGFNGIVYFFGSVTGGLLLEYFISFMPLYRAVSLALIIIGIGRIITSFSFLRIEDPGRKIKNPLLNILFRLNNAGLPSGSVQKQR